MESEDGPGSSLVHVKLPSGDRWGSVGPGQSSTTAQGSRKFTGSKAKPKSSSNKKLNPVVYAATLRAKTAKLCVDVENQLEKACKVADNVLNKIAPEMCGVDAANDGTLDLLRARRELVEVAKSPMQAQDQMAMVNLRLFQLCIADPYLKDCRTTILASEEACQSLGYIKHCRKVTLDLFLGMITRVKYHKGGGPRMCFKYGSGNPAMNGRT